jgi:hypothetical protein
VNGNDFSNGSDAQPMSGGGAVPDAATLVNSMQATGDNNTIPAASVVLDESKAETKPKPDGTIDFNTLQIRKIP